jgi:hypothetical protein
MARLHDADGRVAIPGFYDRVRRPDCSEREYMARVGPSDAEICVTHEQARDGASRAIRYMSGPPSGRH